MKINLFFTLIVLSFFLNPNYSFGDQGKCIEGDCQNGYGVQLNNNNERYEGNFKNGMFEGMGKITAPGVGYFKGRFEENQPYGRGEMFTSDPSSIKWYIDQINPPVYNSKDPELHIEGNFKNGLPDGYCELRFSDGTGYNGYWKEGTYNGRGVLIDSHGDKVEGVWAKDKLKGE